MTRTIDVDIETDSKPKWAPVEPGPAPSFPLVAFPYKSTLRGMVNAGGNTLHYYNNYQEPIHRTQFPYDVYGRVRVLDHELVIDDIDMQGNANNRANMILGLETQMAKAFFFHIPDVIALQLALKSALSCGYAGLIARPFEAKFGDVEYAIVSPLTSQTKVEVDNPT
jgi:hypothetical protein